jgi:hypothetical protein
MDLMFQAAPREPEILPAVEETETPDEQMTLF